MVVDCTGSAAGLRQAISIVRPQGTVVMKSTVHGEVAVDSALIIVNEITLIGSRCGRFEPAMEMLRAGRINLAGMISAEFPLEEAPRAFTEAARHGTLKVLLRNTNHVRTS
jgi:alcohol dehydrogenase